MQIKDLKQDKRNYRKHNDRNLELIKKSVNEVGFGRSVVIDNENEIICGNGVVSTIDKKTPIKVIETDGSELIVVKRTDLSTDDEKRKKLAILDNSTSDMSEFDIELLKTDFAIPELQDFGIDIQIDVPEDTTYTTTVNIPQYEVTGENVNINELYDDSKQKALMEEIERSKLSKEEKEFLKCASCRHIVFNYRKIAEFYAKASSECQKLMENSALVIIDYEDAIKNGYTTLNAKIQEVFEDD